MMTTCKRIMQAEIAMSENNALLAMWFFEADPPQHPVWRHYLMTLATLADLPGLDPARKDFAEATHEFYILALDPTKNPVPDDHRTHQTLLPVNYVHQFAVLDDADAIAACEEIGRLFVNGQCLFETQGIVGANELNRQRINALLFHRMMRGK